MTTPVYIGDEASAAGYRLAGIEVRTPGAATLAETLREVVSQSSFIMLSARLARHLPGAELERLQAGLNPPLLLVPDIAGDAPLPDLATRLRHQLGMLE